MAQKENIEKIVCEIKTNRIGPKEDDNKELKIRNRIVRYTQNGIEMEADLRHAETINNTATWT